MLFGLLNNPLLMLFWIVAILLAITVHECMHAWTANYLGDPTAKYMGRISLNPIRHLDPLGTIFLLLVGFGWGKPVQINERNFKNPRLGSAVTSLAGPLSNLGLILLFSVLYKLGFAINDTVQFAYTVIIYVNVILMVFNLLPIPPLDGSKVLYYFLPKSVDLVKLETYGPFLLLGIFFLGGGILFTFIRSVASFVFGILGIPAF